MSGLAPTPRRSREELRALAIRLFRAAVDAVEPRSLVESWLRRLPERSDSPSSLLTWRSREGPTLVVGAGKAAAGMAAGCEAALVSGLRGEVVVADGCGRSLRSLRCSEAGHPLPDARGQEAASRILELVANAEHGRILCVMSGGASSLLVLPAASLTLPEKVETTNLLLACGADIHELNTVRKHLSRIKGGGLLAGARLPIVTLILSDVLGDDPSVIGSGPTIPDPTTYADAHAVLAKHDLLARVPPGVVAHLRHGMEGGIPETLKPDSSRATLAYAEVIGSAAIALRSAAAVARRCGWQVLVEDAALRGDTSVAARAFARRLLRVLPPDRDVCVLAGGETTVEVRGPGRGGRNQEFALALAEEIEGRDVLVLSAGTDGIDGPTDAAGAFVDGTTCRRARAAGLSPREVLERNDSYSFFATLRDGFVPGPTGTNVMDVKIALLPREASPGGREGTRRRAR